MNSAAFEAIRTQAQSFITATGVTIFWPNQRVAQQTDPTTGEPVPFIWAEITGLAGEQRSMGTPGSNAFRDEGFIRFHLMTPYGEGMDRQYDLAAQLAASYRLSSFSGIQCLAPTPPESGQNPDDDNWYITSFSVPFYYYFYA